MSVIVLDRGEAREREIDGERVLSTAIVAADRPGVASHLGVGYEVDGQARALWGLAGPYNLVQSWRAMRFLEAVPVIQHSTLAACWYAVRRLSGGWTLDRRYADHLEHVLGHGGFKRLRKEVMAQAPTPTKLDEMIQALIAQEVHVSSHELEQEIAAGAIRMTPTIQQLREANAAWLTAQETGEEG